MGTDDNLNTNTMKTKQTAMLVYRGSGRKLVVKKSVDERLISKYKELTGSMREAMQMYREFKLKLEMRAVGRGLV